MLDWENLVKEAVSLRKEEGLTQRDLAAIAGVTPPTVVKFEQGRTSIRYRKRNLDTREPVSALLPIPARLGREPGDTRGTQP